MKLNEAHLPYPVLSTRDDYNPCLTQQSVAIGVECDDNDYTFTVDLNFDNRTIHELINAARAVYACEYRCQSTLMRRIKTSFTPSFAFKVPRKDVNGSIELDCYVAVREPIKGYTNDHLHSDYKGMKFDLEVGDLLVAFPPRQYSVDIQYDKLKSADSIIKFEKCSGTQLVGVDLSRELIFIQLPAELMEQIRRPRVSQETDILHASFVLNALTFALMRFNNPDYEDKRWRRSLHYILSTEKRFAHADLDDIDRLPQLAQQLLQDPYRRLVNRMLNNAPNNDDE